MPRSYSEELVRHLLSSVPDRTLGEALGTACIAANLPAIYVAKVLEVSRMTIHSWFRGKPIRPANMERAERFYNKLSADLESGTLPVKNLAEAREYLQLDTSESESPLDAS